MKKLSLALCISLALITAGHAQFGTNVPGSISPASAFGTNVPAGVTNGSRFATNVPGSISGASSFGTNVPAGFGTNGFGTNPPSGLAIGPTFGTNVPGGIGAALPFGTNGFGWRTNSPVFTGPVPGVNTNLNFFTSHDTGPVVTNYNVIIASGGGQNNVNGTYVTNAGTGNFVNYGDGLTNTITLHWDLSSYRLYQMLDGDSNLYIIYQTYSSVTNGAAPAPTLNWGTN